MEVSVVQFGMWGKGVLREARFAPDWMLSGIRGNAAMGHLNHSYLEGDKDGAKLELMLI